VSGPPPELVAVLVPNGLGHARRTVGVIARYLERGGEAAVTIVGESWQESASLRWPAGRLLADHGAVWVPGIVAPGVHWSTDPGVYDDGRLLAWEERLDDVPSLATAEIVLTDNLVGVLTRRPDALLLGSFLWSDVLGAVDPTPTPAVRAFVAHEQELLARHRPEMLCVEGLATPGVLDRTQAVPVGWMCQGRAAFGHHDPTAAPAGHEVAVLGGWTGAADDLLVDVAVALGDDGHVVTAAESIATRAGVTAFDPTSDRWEHTAAVVCRPGAGTITDCIDWRVPVVCVDEGSNSELRHNGGRVEALGLGVDAGCGADTDAVVRCVRQVLEPERHAEIRGRMAAADVHGLDQAADWLAVHCGARLAAPRARP
jgi:hypothetical protein